MSGTPRKPSAPSRGGGLWKAVVTGVVALSVGVAIAVVVRDRASVAAVAQSARSAVSAHRIDEAHRLIDKWAALRPRDGEPDYCRARLWVIVDQPVEALAAMRRALDRGYPVEPVYILRAVLEARAGQFGAAEPVLKHAIETSAEPAPEIAEGLARMYLGTFRLAEASRALEHWMQAAPEDARPYLWRNQVDERIGADNSALIYNYRVALRLDPSLDSARLGLADLLRKSHKVDEGEVEYATYLSRNPKSVEAHDGAGQIALLKGDLVGAARHFNEALALNPKDPVALREIALIHLRNGQFASARDRFKMAVELAPFDPEVRFNYARALELSGDGARAAEESLATERLRSDQRRIDELRQALVQRPGDADLRCEAAKWLIDHGHEKEGLEWTELILRQAPGHPQTCRILADFHARRGNVGLANYYRMAAPPPHDRPPP
jgi:Tfp pilus assembly protein PilF